jgi:hypothetical protein
VVVTGTTVLLPVAGDIVDWNALLKVIWVSLAAGIGVTGAFAFAIMGATRAVDLRRDGHLAQAGVMAAVMVVGLAASGAAIVLGIVALTAK